MDYIIGVIKADWDSRKKYFMKHQMDFVINMLLVTGIGFPACYFTIDALIASGYHNSIFMAVVLVYWLSSIFWGWRLLRFFRKKK
jgi:hypothetical protein